MQNPICVPKNVRNITKKTAGEGISVGSRTEITGEITGGNQCCSPVGPMAKYKGKAKSVM